MNPLLTGTTTGVRAAPADTAAAAYLRRYPGVAANERWGKDPYGHYLRYGQAEGRIWEEPGATSTVPEAVKAAADAIPAFAAPGADMYANTADGWDAYMQAGRAAVEGMNRMPFVFSNYAGIPEDPAVGNALFYGGRGDPNAAAALNNPVLAAAAGQPFVPNVAAPVENPLLSAAGSQMQVASQTRAPVEPVYFVAQTHRDGNDSTPTVSYFNTQTGYSSPHAGGPVITEAQWARMQQKNGARR